MNEKIHHLRPALAVECEEQMGRLGLSQNRAARRIGISAAALSQWRHGCYSGDSAGIEDRVRRWLSTEDEVEGNSPGDDRLDRHLEFRVTREIASRLAHAQATGDIVLVKGSSGTGKSWAARRFAETHSATHCVTVTGAVRSLAGLLGMVVRATGSSGAVRSALEAEQAAVANLRGRNSLLIVDEAHHLSSRLLDELRCIRDLAGCGLALIGDWSIDLPLARCPQVVGRIGGRVQRREPSRADVDLMVSAFLERPAGGGAVRTGLEVACRPGGFHRLRRTLADAWRLAHIEDRDTVTDADLMMAAYGTAPQAGTGDGPAGGTARAEASA
ncbi:MAG: AAA family ATPase [Rhodobacteraceae bacterium]|nr:AAA family ATPase [Paracoccaceae bacterium]